MKRAFILFVAFVAPVALFAVPMGPWYGPGQFAGLIPHEAGPYYTTEVLNIQSEMGQQKIGDFDVAAIVSLRDRLDIAAQKDAYVRDMSLHSRWLPGLGQFEMGDTGSGFAFLGLDLATWAATLVGVYYTLPSDLRFDRIDYLHDSFSTINNAWNGHNFVDYLPAMGVFFAGVIVDQVVRHWSSTSAGHEATERIDNGSVKFTPRIGVGFMGFDVAY